MFPITVIHIIAGYAATPQLLSWIPYAKLKKKHLRSIAAAYDAGYCSWDDVDETSHGYLLKNTHPNAVAIVKQNMRFANYMTFGWANPALIDVLLDDPKHSKRIDWQYLSENPSKRAVDLMLANPIHIYDGPAVKNPGLIAYSRDHELLTPRSGACANPHQDVIDIISQWPDSDLCWVNLCRNSHPWALEKLRVNQDRIHWDILSSNPSIFEYREDPGIIAALMDFRWI